MQAPGLNSSVKRPGLLEWSTTPFTEHTNASKLLLVLAATVGMALLVEVGRLSATSPVTVLRMSVGLGLSALFIAKPSWLIIAWAAAAMFGDRLVAGGTVFGAMTYVSLPAFAIALLRGLIPVVKRHAWVGYWCLFTTMVLINMLRAPIPLADALRNGIGYLDALALSVVIINEAKSRRLVQHLPAVVMPGALIIAAIAWQQYVTQTGGADSAGVYRVHSIFGGDIAADARLLPGQVAANDPGGWANTLAFFLLAPLGLATYLGVGSRTTLTKIASAACVFGLTGAMIFTFGRGGWIAGAIAVLGPLLMTRGAKWRWVFVVALGAAVLVLVPVLSSSLGDRLEDPTNILGREVVWNVGLHAAMGAPVFGHGFWGDYTFFATTADTLVARGFHNIYLLVFYDFGLVGLVLFIATWLAFWTEAAIQVRSHADSRRAVYLTASAVLLAVLIFEAAANLLWDFSPSIYLWLTLAWASAWGESAGSVHVA